jgi:hypothetical protein
MNNAIRKILSFFLLTAFLIASDPGHFTHQFTDHHDSTECHYGDITVSAKHIHCSVLQLSLPAFTGSTAPIICESFSFPSVLFFEAKIQIPEIFLLRASGRAPPVLA